jgi:hypothetical protein
VTLGAQFALSEVLRATLWGQGRYLRHGLGTTRCVDIPTPGPCFDNLGRLDHNIPATRETELLAFSLELHGSHTALRAGVMWGRTVGTWTGPYDPQQGFNLLLSPAQDVASNNSYGSLPTDPGGRAFVEAERTGTLGSAAVWIASRMTVGSGTPRNVLASGPDGVVELLPRGSAGRNPVIAQANLRLAARWQGLTTTLDIINLFARREVTNLDETYADDSRPIDGGSYEDLVFLKNATGAPPDRVSTADRVSSTALDLARRPQGVLSEPRNPAG